MRYKSSTLAEINRLIAALNQSGHFPYNISNEIADKHGLNVNLVRNALKGLPANISILRSTVEEAEKLAKLKPPNVPKRKVRGYTIPELYTKSLLPAKYCELTAEIAGLKPNAVAYFIKNQLEALF